MQIRDGDRAGAQTEPMNETTTTALLALAILALTWRRDRPPPLSAHASLRRGRPGRRSQGRHQAQPQRPRRQGGRSRWRRWSRRSVTASTRRRRDFLGAPIDYVVFDGLGRGELREVVLVEVKTGASRLSASEREVDGRSLRAVSGSRRCGSSDRVADQLRGLGCVVVVLVLASAARRTRAGRPSHPRDDVTWQVRDALADDVVDRDERALCAHRGADRRPRAAGRWRKRLDQSVGQVRRASRDARAGRAASGRGRAAGGRGRRARSRPRRRRQPRLLAGDDRAEAAVASRRRPLRQRSSARRARRRARARRGRRCSRRRPGPGTGAAAPSASVETESTRRLGDVVEVVDLAVLGGAQALGEHPGGDRRHVALRGAAQHRDRERAVVEPDALADPDRAVAEVGERVGVLGDRGDALDASRRRPRARIRTGLRR